VGSRAGYQGFNDAGTHFLATEPGAAGYLGLAQHYYPVAACSVSKCRLDIGLVSSYSPTSGLAVG
jgi:hypothetical protein